MLQNTDLFIVERAGVQYHMTADRIADFVGAVRDFTTANITSRDALTDLKVGDRVFVTDASSEADVDSGWAIYRLATIGPNTFEKIQEQESLDLMIVTEANLSVSTSPANIVINNDNGTSATIPLADSTNAGLMSPAAFDNIHVEVTTGLTSASNPIVVTGQELNFSITQLTPLP